MIIIILITIIIIIGINLIVRCSGCLQRKSPPRARRAAWPDKLNDSANIVMHPNLSYAVADQTSSPSE